MGMYVCFYQFRYSSWSLCSDGLDRIEYINLSFCLQLFNQRPNCYECATSTKTITTCIEDSISISVNLISHINIQITTKT